MGPTAWHSLQTRQQETQEGAATDAASGNLLLGPYLAKEHAHRCINVDTYLTDALSLDARGSFAR